MFIYTDKRLTTTTPVDLDFCSSALQSEAALGPESVFGE